MKADCGKEMERFMGAWRCPDHGYRCPSHVGASEAQPVSPSTTGSASAAAELSESGCVSEPDKAQRPESKTAGDEAGVDNSVVQLPVSDPDGVALIAIERLLQIKKGYTPKNDQIHFAGQLAHAAVCYTLIKEARGHQGDIKMPYHWPWYGTDKEYKPGNGTIAGRIGELVKAGALIAAEIDRLQYNQAIRRPQRSGVERRKLNEKAER